MSNNTKAKFNISTIFDVINREKVIIGTLIEGELNKGDTFELVSDDEKFSYSISSVEAVNIKGIFRIGLYILSHSDPDLTILEQAAGLTILIN
ncbi:hypothetical protein DYU05_13600 [Mucilaginibacter terrenus]|uniref:Uncharacterized protein n=1 Tax=Mucilaginibacter terrenus TaxID=2482727 RepID=A0A3E2NQA8_9SPHI|nr:hypothetical protein [Mucilaginibacter terrenus]RFZ83175.1 hypothetical protein DYU05_13600 [Mucilaginibacter terrenus]